MHNVGKTILTNLKQKEPHSLGYFSKRLSCQRIGPSLICTSTPATSANAMKRQSSAVAIPALPVQPLDQTLEKYLK